MKTIINSTIVVVIFLICSDGLSAQTTKAKLNQAELHKQFVGTWRSNVSEDIFLLFEMKPYGTGFEGSRRYITNGKVYKEGKRLYGYDKKIDKYIVASVIKGDDIVRSAQWFISDKKCVGVRYGDINHSDKAAWRYEIEFKSPDSWVETAIVNNLPAGTAAFFRVKQ